MSISELHLEDWGVKEISRNELRRRGELLNNSLGIGKVNLRKKRSR